MNHEYEIKKLKEELANVCASLRDHHSRLRALERGPGDGAIDDPNNLEGPPRTREEMAADARELDAVAPTPAEKFALMFSAGKPDPKIQELARCIGDLRQEGGVHCNHPTFGAVCDALDAVSRERPTVNPDYVDAPMQVSVTTIDPATGEVKQGVATTDEQLRGWMKVIRPDPDDDLDEPLPPKQCDIDDGTCESCQ